MALFEFLGRLHPILLHLPIGILAMAFIMEGLGRFEKFKYLLPAVGFALGVGMLSSIIAAGSGYVLSLEGGYNEVLLWRHKWLGIGTAATAIILFFLHQKKDSSVGQKIYFPIFGILIVLLGLTGHNGGSMTHGEEFLIEPFTIDRSAASREFILDSALVFQDLVQPIFEEKCVSCHNDSKIKGELLMTSIAGIKKGGASGAFLQAGNVANSLFLQRIELPLVEKEHMPPKGKSQLSKEEVTLLKWWVAEGAQFDKHLVAMNISDKVQTILDKREAKNNSVLAQEVDAASQSDLKKLTGLGYTIEVVEQDKSFVNVSLAGNKNLDQNTIVALTDIKEQLMDLDISSSNLSDDLLPSFSNFPHLRKLFLQNTAITGKGFDELADLKFLEYLNLYNSPVEDQALTEIAKIKSLKHLYLWKTKLSSEAIKKFKQDRSDIVVNTGIGYDIFGKSILSAPVIIAEKDIFSDSIEIEIDMNFSEVELYYTLDGSIPDSSSARYSVPFFVNQTSQIQVIGKKDGWETSEIAEKTVVRARYEIAKATLNKQPSDKYKGEGASSLVNYKKGNTNFTDGEWLGYEKSHFITTLDIGAVEAISGVTVSALEAANSYIFFPKNIEISISEDGKSYQSVKQKSIPTSTAANEPRIKNFFLDFEDQKARYVKVEVQSNLTNPSWHPAPGAPCWLFVDEIMVE